MNASNTRLPNLLLVGVQKSGTTWLHQVLSASQHIFGSDKKEVNFWGRSADLSRLDEYRAHFPVNAKPTARYFLESTPHYFHAPNIFVDIANQIKGAIPDVRPIVILRNPVDRYRSAYVHHMQKGRLDYTPEIDVMTDDQIMLSTGMYGRILAHWQSVFPDMLVYSYDDLMEKPGALLTNVFCALDIPCDIDLAALAEPVHTSARKVQKSGWPVTPRLTSRLQSELIEFYREDTTRLQKLVQFDVMHWLVNA